MSFGESRPTAERDLAFVCRTAILLLVLICLLSCQRVPPSETETRRATNEQSASPITLVAGQKETTTASTEEQEEDELRQVATPISGKDLYSRHCAACHGELGDGKGLAAPYLFPKPRDFRAGRFRLVSTDNNVPTRDDLLAVLLRGMPGSAMPPWRHLTQAEREALVDEVLRLRETGTRESYIRYLEEEEELTDEEIAEEEVQEDIKEYVHDFTTPGESRSVPAIKEPDEMSIAHGRDIYVKQGCVSCHGKEGKGDGVEKMTDAEGLPTSPRDFTLGIFKGGHDPASLFRRVAYGMPGTPMPGSSSLKAEEVVDLVHFIRSLSSEEVRESAILNREVIHAKQVKTLPGSPDVQVWSDVSPVKLRVTPLWWRNDANSELQVQAVHDGKTLALRITWPDLSRDERATQSESFEDAVAMELYRGNAEPFLGMGSSEQPVDVWFWDADRQTKADIEDQYANTVVDVYPFSEKAVETAEYRRPGTSQKAQPEFSLPAVASGNPIVPAQATTGASELTAGGPGSVTFRLPKNPLVTSAGIWSAGHWTVVMRRPLEVLSPDEGVSLSPGEKVSVAFALWDGLHKDRNGQKKITVWQDLELEK